jgi:hypothetical protein
LPKYNASAALHDGVLLRCRIEEWHKLIYARKVMLTFAMQDRYLLMQLVESFRRLSCGRESIGYNKRIGAGGSGADGHGW